MASLITLSIMPTINGRHRPDLYATPTVKGDMPDEEVGEVLGDFLRMIRDEGVVVGSDMVELNRHHALSLLANAEERISVLIDEDEQDEAKEEVAVLVAAMRRWLESTQ